MSRMIFKLLMVSLGLIAMACQSFADPLTEANLAYNLGNYSKALSLYKQLAETGDAKAEYVISEMYRDGRGTSQDIREAIRWLRLAAEHGNVTAQGGLGTIYESGKLLPRDVKAAFFWIEKAALAGDPLAQLNLGWAYMSDYLELPSNYKLAMEWSLKAADQGEGEGSSNVALLYENGWGVPVNYSEAVMWYRKAINQGFGSGQAALHLAGLYEMGLGVEKDLDHAAKLYQIVVDGGDEEFASEAQKRLLFIQGRLKLKEVDDIQYPQEMTPARGRRAPRHG